ncbi:MAG: ATP-binding protein, partial [Clostridia bacterium]
RDYLELQQMHFSGRLQVTVSVEPEIENCSMMKLILQPLVENAIYHGMSMTEGRGQIRVLGFAEGETLVFQVSDDGIGIAPEELALLTGYINGQNDAFTSIGLKNTNRRIKLYYNEEHGLAIRSVLGAGTSITVRIPRVGGESTCDPC